MDMEMDMDEAEETTQVDIIETTVCEVSKNGNVNIIKSVVLYLGYFALVSVSAVEYC